MSQAILIIMLCIAITLLNAIIYFKSEEIAKLQQEIKLDNERTELDNKLINLQQQRITQLGG